MQRQPNESLEEWIERVNRSWEENQTPLSKPTVETSEAEKLGRWLAGEDEAAEVIAECGSPHCAGCYEVEPGVRIHPPRESREWLRWRAYWDEKAKEREAREAAEKQERKAKKLKFEPEGEVISEAELEQWLFRENEALDKQEPGF